MFIGCAFVFLVKNRDQSGGFRRLHCSISCFELHWEPSLLGVQKM